MEKKQEAHCFYPCARLLGSTVEPSPYTHYKVTFNRATPFSPRPGEMKWHNIHPPSLELVQLVGGHPCGLMGAGVGEDMQGVQMESHILNKHLGTSSTEQQP